MHALGQPSVNRSKWIEAHAVTCEPKLACDDPDHAERCARYCYGSVLELNFMPFGKRSTSVDAPQQWHPPRWAGVCGTMWPAGLAARALESTVPLTPSRARRARAGPGWCRRWPIRSIAAASPGPDGPGLLARSLPGAIGGQTTPGSGRGPRSGQYRAKPGARTAFVDRAPAPTGWAVGPSRSGNTPRRPRRARPPAPSRHTSRAPSRFARKWPHHAARGPTSAVACLSGGGAPFAVAGGAGEAPKG